MKLTKRELLTLNRLLPNQTVESVIEIAEFIEETHTLQTIKAMLNDGKYIEPALRIFYEGLLLHWEM